MLIGFYVAGKVTDSNLLSEGVHDWNGIWTFPVLFAVAVMVLFAIFFKNEKVEEKHL